MLRKKVLGTLLDKKLNFEGHAISLWKERDVSLT